MANFNVFNDNLQKYSLDFQNDEIYKLHMNGGGDNPRVGTLYAQKNPFSKAKFVLIQDVPESGSMFSRGVGHVSKSIQEIWLKFLSLIGIASNTEDKINGLRDKTTTNLNNFRGLDGVNAFARDLLDIRDDVNNALVRVLAEKEQVEATLAAAQQNVENVQEQLRVIRDANNVKDAQIALFNQGARAVVGVAAENQQLRAQVTEAQLEIEGLRGINANISEILRRNDELIQQLNAAELTVGEKERAIAEKEQEIAEKEQEIAEKEQAIAEKDVTITNLQSDKGKRATAASFYNDVDKENNEVLGAKTRIILDQAANDLFGEGLDALFD